MGQKPLLAPKSPPIADQLAVTADNAMTGDNYDHRVPVVGLPDGPS